MKADRLLSILLLLQNEGKLTAKALASRLEVSERTIQRDMESLAMAGVPVYAERGSHGGWQLMAGYRTNLTGMKAEELMSLLVAASPHLLHDLGIRQHFELAMQKLLASSPESMKKTAETVRKKIHIDGAGWHQSGESCPCLAVVQEAVLSERSLRIRYHRNADCTERMVNPLGLVAKRSVWYLVAETDGEIRTFRVSRIADAELLDQRFRVPEHFDLADYWEQSTSRFKETLPRYPARIRVKTHLLPRLEQDRYIKVLQKTEEPDGWVNTDMEFATLEHGCWTVLGFAAGAEVLEPPELRKAVAACIREMMDLYRE